MVSVLENPVRSPSWPNEPIRRWAWIVPPGEAWARFLATQSVPRREVPTPQDFVLLHRQLPASAPPTLDRTLLEQLLWGLLGRPDCDAIVYPLYASLYPREPVRIVAASSVALRTAMAAGYLALCRPEAAAALAHAEGLAATDPARDLAGTVQCFSRALLEERSVVVPQRIDADPPPPRITRALARLRSHLTPGQWAWLKRQALRVRTVLSTGPAPQLAAAELPLARQRHWQPPFIRPRIDVTLHRSPERIPVWMAMHWLELGGAERFAIDLIRALPKDRYAVHVTTDVPAENAWASEIRDAVEEIIHLPTFLPPWMIGIFCEHFVRSRGIRLLHLHHAPRVYESLFHLRRFHPELIVLHTLHILELPPHSGGYPEWVMANFGVFIDHHHVISDQLRRFLRQRWFVPPERIDLIRINVDTRHFDPATVRRGRIRARCGIPEDALVVAFLGRLTGQKRPLELVDLATLLGQAWRHEGGPEPLHFVIAGSGDLRPAVGAAIAASPVADSIHLLEAQVDPRPLYRDADLLVLPSENEGLALVTYEAMAMGTPVFSTDVGAQAEVLEAEQLVPPGAPVAPALADRVWPFLLDAERRRSLAARQRAKVLRHHDAAESLASLQDLYARLLSNQHAGRRPQSAQQPSAAAPSAGRGEVLS